MKFGQWGDRPAKEDGSFSFGPLNVVNSTTHTAPSALIKEEGRSCRAKEGLGFWGVGDGCRGGGVVRGEKRCQGELDLGQEGKEEMRLVDINNICRRRESGIDMNERDGWTRTGGTMGAVESMRPLFKL